MSLLKLRPTPYNERIALMQEHAVNGTRDPGTLPAPQPIVRPFIKMSGKRSWIGGDPTQPPAA